MMPMLLLEEEEERLLAARAAPEERKGAGDQGALELAAPLEELLAEAVAARGERLVAAARAGDQPGAAVLAVA